MEIENLKFNYFITENWYFSLILKLCLNSIFFLKIQVGNQIFPASNKKSFFQVIIVISFHINVSKFGEKYSFNPYKFFYIRNNRKEQNPI